MECKHNRRKVVTDPRTRQPHHLLCLSCGATCPVKDDAGRDRRKPEKWTLAVETKEVK